VAALTRANTGSRRFYLRIVENVKIAERNALRLIVIANDAGRAWLKGG
jgi:hypothetical protein